MAPPEQSAVAPINATANSSLDPIRAIIVPTKWQEGDKPSGSIRELIKSFGVPQVG
jgi:hypothetical protein